MRPIILIIERQPDVANALEEIVHSASYVAIVRPHIERLADLDVMPAAIIVRVAFEGVGEPAHAVIERLAPNRPPVVAIVREDAEAAEAARLRCDVVLRAPHDVRRLHEALITVVRN